MAEPPAAPRSGAAVSEQDVLLATKLHVPRQQPGFVARPRLTGRLDEALAGRLILVCAPAGFGKTSLLADWARRGGRSAAWLSLDAGDNDPARFWRHVVAALDRVRPGIADQVGPLLGPPAPPSFEGVITALINTLADQPGGPGGPGASGDPGGLGGPGGPAGDEVLLALDDYHLIDAEPVHTSLIFLLEHLPPGLPLVLASRSDPPLPLARLRAGGQLTELRAGDLRFTTDEAAALLGAAVGPGLPATAVEALAERTEGWAAGLQLAALSLPGQADVPGFVTAFGGSHRYVLDYLAGEVLEGQGEDMRGFLLETSVLERLSGALCDAVTGRADSQTMLEAIERANLFLLPLDEVRGWWRYHHLFADLLRARLRQERPDRVGVLHRAAAAWCDGHGLADDAVRYAAAAGDVVWAARLIERHFDALFYLRGEAATVQRWLAALPAEVIGSRPRLCLAQAALASTSGRVEVVGGLLDDAERASAAAADEPFEPSVGRGVSLLVNVPATIALFRAWVAEIHGDAEATAAFASRALAGIGDGEQMLEFVTRGHLAVAEWLRGQPAVAERTLASGIAGWRAVRQPTLIAWAGHHLGEVQRARGRLDAALRTYQQTLETNAPRGQPTGPAAGVGYVGMAEVAYQRGKLDAALRHVTEGITLCQQLSYTPPLAAGLATLAWIRQASGDASGALDAMGAAERVAPGTEVTSLLNPVPAQWARLQLAQGDVEAAARWTRQRGLAADHQPAYPQEREYLVLARVLLAQDRPGPALTLLNGMRDAAAAQGRTGSVIETQALQALALAAGGEETAALDVLAGVLTLACPQGYVRVFADEGPPMSALLRRLLAAQRAGQAAACGVPPRCLSHLLRAFGGKDAADGSGRRAAAVPGLAEQLTARELEILAFLAEGAPNPRIAEELLVTVDTVKKHVSHVLGKLGTANRTEAVTRAHQLGLIP